MDLPKAIEILTINALEEGTFLPPDYIEALKLGIEALRRIKECRLADHMIAEDWLPGETKEV